MARSKTYKIGDLFFPSTEELDKFVQRLPYTYKQTALRDGRADVIWDDYVFICHVIAEQHPDAIGKIGSGIHGCYYVPDDFGGVTLMLHRREGDTSVCLAHLRKNPSTYRRDKAAKAFRDAIRTQIQDKVAQAFTGSTLVCPITKREFTRSKAEVDHQPPVFKDLVKNFLAGTDLSDVRVIDLPTGGVSLPPPVDSEWPKYHAKHANLLVISSEAHKEVTRSRRRARTTTVNRPTRS